MVHDLNPSTKKAGAGRALWFWGPPGLYSKLPASLGNTVRYPVFKKKKKVRRKRRGRVRQQEAEHCAARTKETCAAR